MGLKTDLFKLAETYGIQKVVEELKNLEERYGEFYHPDDYLLVLK